MIFTVLLLVILAFSAASISLIWYQNYSRFYRLLEKIPGPIGYPIIGNIFTITAPPVKVFESLRRQSKIFSPIYRQWSFHIGLVTIVNPEDAEVVLSSPKHITKSPLYDSLHGWLGTGLLTSTGKKWQCRRKILTPGFHFKILKEFVNVFNEKTVDLLEQLRGAAELDQKISLVPVISELTLNAVVESAFGIKMDKASEAYRENIYKIGPLIIYRMVRPWFRWRFPFDVLPQGVATKKCVKILHGFTKGIIAKRKREDFASSERKAMLDLLLTAQKEGNDIDDEGIREEVDTFTFEGYDTTSMGLCFILLVLANNRKEQNEIRQEILEVLGDRLPTYTELQELPYTERCLKECLRLYPSVPLIGRIAEEDIHTATGYTIPKGALLDIQIFDIHRIPEIYPDPEKFDPDRFLPENIAKRHPFAYIPFSAGPRNCIGQKFAMLELKAALCGILREFDLEPITTRDEVKFSLDLILRATSEIYVKFAPIKKNNLKKK